MVSEIVRYAQSKTEGNVLEDFENDLDDEEILELFPELCCVDDFREAYIERETPVRRYAVYNGKCKKCGGFVEETRESFDDDVWHCLLCGWRTSPIYEQNKAFHVAAGGLI